MNPKNPKQPFKTLKHTKQTLSNLNNLGMPLLATILCGALMKRITVSFDVAENMNILGGPRDIQDNSNLSLTMLDRSITERIQGLGLHGFETF